jgi:hypothetical protein
MIGISGRALLGCGALIGLFSGTAAADGMPPRYVESVRPWVWEFGGRYWYSTGKSKKDLNGPENTPFSSVPFSRLTYDDLTAHSGEAFFRVDHASRLFVKGYIGAGKVVDGNLTDEDFPPAVLGYSNTSSEQRNGRLSYFNVDLGYTILESRSRAASIKDDYRSGGYRLGVFTGYHYWKEEVHAYGCTQNVAGQPDGICIPAIPVNTLGISQDNRWDSWRLGVVGDFNLGARWKLTAEAAYARTWLDGADTHHLRTPPACNAPFCFAGPLKEDGDGHGVQLEAVLSYQVTDQFNLGVGGRYWHLETNDGHTHFRFLDGFTIDSPVKWEQNRYGVFLQGSLKLN